eukprot:2664718-Pyramimonas_sp.AAC.2
MLNSGDSYYSEVLCVPLPLLAHQDPLLSVQPALTDPPAARSPRQGAPEKVLVAGVAPTAVYEFKASPFQWSDTMQVGCVGDPFCYTAVPYQAVSAQGA